MEDNDKHLKTFPDLETYVDFMEGTRPLRRILLANNGIAAVKFIRSVRNWSYATFNNEKEVQFVVMATPEDLLANAEYIRYSDQVCHVPGGCNINNYANVNLIVEIAQQYKVDAVWAGWGHASENPRLPYTLDNLDIVFVGPGGGPMYALGDKIGSTIIAQSAKVPTIAWNGDGLETNYAANGGVIPDELYSKANVTTVEDARIQIEKLGVPVMIKASEGGGGKGIRMVDDLSKVEAAFRQVQSELPGSPIFIMRLSTGARHLEVQLLADAYGQAIALSGRDCSVQRRHQKILEEGPPAAAKPDVWIEMEKAAVRLAQEVGYCNAGTVEYLYDSEDNFYFLELNPRLQVEHPVTEMITGVNLPASQLQVSMGIPLHRIPDIRKFYRHDDLYSRDKIDFDGKYADKPTVSTLTLGHTIAARITAENPFNGFQPTSGQITEINFRSSRNVWGYFSVDSSGRVHEFADSQIGHVFAWGENREEARRNLAMALNDLSIRGEIRTTIEYLKDLIEVPEYRNNQFDTAWLDKRIKANVDIAKIDPLTVILVGAAITSHKHIVETVDSYRQMLERGQLPPANLLQQSHTFQLIYENIKYPLEVSRTGAITYRVKCNGSGVDVELRSLADGGFLLLMGGKSHVAYSKSDVGAQRYIIDQHTCLFADEYDPTQMRAQMGGKLLRFLVEDGALLKKGDPYAEIEVMKMNMTLSALEDGTISLVKPEGSVMEPGDVICTMELSDPSKVRKADMFTGQLPVLGEPWPQALDNMPQKTLERARALLDNVMQGYDITSNAVDAALADLASAANSPLLPVLEIEGFLSCNKNALPSSKMVRELEDLCKSQRVLAAKGEQDEDATKKFAVEVLRVCEVYGASAPTATKVPMEGLKTQASRYTEGLPLLQANICAGLVKQYVDIESKFAELEQSDAAEKDDVVQELRVQHSDDLPLVVGMSLAYRSRKARDGLVIALLGILEKLVRERASKADGRKVRSKCAEVVKSVAGLQGQLCTDVALEARQGLIELEHSYRDTMASIVEQIKAYRAGDEGALKTLTQNSEPVLSYLMDVIVQPQYYDTAVRLTAMELYVRRVYSSYEIVDVKPSDACVQGDSANNHVALATYFTFFSNAYDSVLVGGTRDLAATSLTSATSLNDLSELLSPGNGVSLSNMAGGSNQSEEATETSSVGIEIDSFDTEEVASKASYALKRGVQLRQNLAEKARSQSIDIGDALLGDRTSKGRSNVSTCVAPFVHRAGLLCHFADFSAMEQQLLPMITALGAEANKDINVLPEVQPQSVVHVVLACEFTNEDELAFKLQRFVKDNCEPQLRAALIRRITFAVVSLGAAAMEEASHSIVAGHGGHFFTFRNSSRFTEDRLVRNIETPLAFQLDLQRLSNFNIRLVSIGKQGASSRAQTVHVYEATPKVSATGLDDKKNKKSTEKRFFVRALVRNTEKIKDSAAGAVGEFDAYPGPERVFVQALRALESLQSDKTNGAGPSLTRKNHIFLNLLSDSAEVNSEYVEGIIRTLHRRYAKRLLAVDVTQFEIKLFAVLAENAPSISIRIVASNPTGFALNIDSYVEASDPSDASNNIFYSLSEGDGGLGGALAAMGLGATDQDLALGGPGGNSEQGHLHGKSLNTPYELSDPFDSRRAIASRSSTTFCFDFPDLFAKALQFEWSNLATEIAPKPLQMPARRQLVTVQELILDDEMESNMTKLSHGLCTTSRAPGRNQIAMVAWLVTLRTPQYPDGRKLVLLANDITVKAGSFGTREDCLFDCVSKLARSEGLPRLYIAANSGARIGMAEEVKRAFKVKWSNDADPTKGFDYFYIEEEDYDSLGPEGRKSVVATKMPENTQQSSRIHYRIDAIIGETPDLGVENLRGSGTIAGETARAYDESFTLSYVSGRSVGIGSYLNRLGQRVIQKGNNAPILLTGYQALNSLMGRDVYTSNLQLGGTKIMYGNGVSHYSVRHDLEGVSKIITWLSYVPERWQAPSPLTPMAHGERVERPVAAHPRNLEAAYDPRLLLNGYIHPTSGEWMAGLFDKGSFEETLGGWAKTVITARARLGGIPVGVITSEVRTVEARTPADPAAPDTTERVWQQAGQVWFPDSSFKTAQALRDFNRENLAVIVLANWRGFSGGTRDMMDQVLKFGAQIVDALVEFKQPVFVHIPPGGELRGGAWVVVDPTINANVMEMTADTDARGGVLEAPGAASIKFRKADMLATMHRLDPQLAAMVTELKQLDEENCAYQDKRANLVAKISAREKMLLPIYHQIAIQFADNHDKPQRMLAKGVIRGIVPWEESRTYFYNRLKRRTAEKEAQRRISSAFSLFSPKDKAASMENEHKSAEILELMITELQVVDWENDKAVSEFLLSEEGKEVVEAHVSAIQSDAIAKQVVAMGEEDPKAILRGLMSLIKTLQVKGRMEERDGLVNVLKQGLLLLH